MGAARPAQLPIMILPSSAAGLRSVPLLFDPGRQWRYSAAADVQALLVENGLAAMPFETYVRRHIFDPLGMKDSGWTQPESRFARLAALYKKGADGKLERGTDQEQRGLNFTPSRKLTMGGAGNRLDRRRLYAFCPDAAE